MQRDLAAMRRDYRQGTLTEEMAGVDPLTLFDQWIVAARDAGQIEANAMTLATVDAMGHPHARIVLLKEQVARDFVFFTNYQSAKGQQLAASPCAALVFWWDVLERQVRIEGPVRRIDPKDSDAYFASRPLSSRLGAWASEQSKPITDHAVLEMRYAEHAAHYGEAVPRPTHWGGYAVAAEQIEFWQGRSSRLHDRLQYAWDGHTWNQLRLAP